MLMAALGTHPAYAPAVINQTSVTAIITLPRLKTGRILASMDPQEVAQHQILPVSLLSDRCSLAPVALV